VLPPFKKLTKIIGMELCQLSFRDADFPSRKLSRAKSRRSRVSCLKSQEESEELFVFLSIRSSALLPYAVRRASACYPLKKQTILMSIKIDISKFNLTACILASFGSVLPLPSLHTEFTTDLSAGTQNRPLLGTLKPAIFRVIEMIIFITLPPEYWRKKNGKHTENGKAVTHRTIIRAWLVVSPY